MTPEDKEKLIKAVKARADFRETLRNDPKAATEKLGINLSDNELQQLRESLADNAEDDRLFEWLVASASSGKKKTSTTSNPSSE